MFNSPRSTLSTTIVDESTPKQVKLGQYTIRKEKRLGCGSYSRVFLCQDKNGKKAAVKMLRKNGEKSSQVLKVAKAQAKILKKLDNPSITKYIGSFESQNNFYILFNFYDGQTLKDVLKQKYRLEIKDVITVISNLLNAFSYLYEKKIMHRDIKPENIIFNSRKATLIDFGFAYEMAHGQKTLIKDWVGTPSYMSPELLQRKKYTWKSDIWSFGVLVYEVVYGNLPWKGQTEHELLTRITNKELQFPSNIFIPDQIKTLIKDCLEKDPEKRIGWKELLKYKKYIFLKGNVDIEYEDNVHNCYCQLICG